MASTWLFILQVRQTMYVYLWHGGTFMWPLLHWKSNTYYIFWVCVCTLSFPACNAHASYCHLWPVWLYLVFPHFLINSMNFGKKLLNTKCVLWFSLQLLSETVLFLKRTEWDMIKYTHIHVKYPSVLSDFNETWIFNIFLKNIKISNFMKIHRVGADGFSMQTEKQTWQS